MRSMAILLGVTLLTGNAAADPTGSEDPEARHRYEAGLRYYDAGDYGRAIGEFEAANARAPSAAFHYNVARCEERLGRTVRAVAAYERYLATAPNDAATNDLRVRVDVLRGRLHPGPDPRALRIGAAVVSAIGTATLVGGFGAYFSVYGDYQRTGDRCAQMGGCAAEELAGLRSDVRIAQTAGAVLWSVAGLAALVQIPLWIHSRRSRPAWRAETRP